MRSYSPIRTTSILFFSLIALLACGLPQLLSAQSVTLTQTGPVNFGSANVCPPSQATPAPCSKTTTLTYDVAAGITIGSVNILTTGDANLDFHAKASDTSTTLCAATHYAAATTCTVDVTFAPLAPGQRKGAVQIVDGSGGVLANTYIYGTGVGPAITFTPTLPTPLTLGSGLLSPEGVVIDASGNLFITDTGNNVVKEILAAGGYTTIKTVATGFNGPNGIAIDGSGNLFIADTKNVEVKEVLAVAGSIPATPTIKVLGSGFVEPLSVAVDASGNVFVNDVTNNGGSDVAGRVHPNDIPATTSEIKEIIAVDGSIPTDPTITTIGGFTGLNFLKLDGNGNLYTGYFSYQGEVFELTAASGYQSAQDITGDFIDPESVAIDAAGDVYVSDNDSSSLFELLAVNGSIPANPTLVLLTVGSPADLAIDGSGNLFLTSYGSSGIIELPNAQPPTLTFHTTAPGTTSPDSPKSIQVQNIGNTTLTGSGALSDATDFTVVAGAGVIPDCNAATLSLATGAACNLSFDFTPQSAGPLSSTLTLTDNSFNGNPATQKILLSSTTQAIATSTYLSSSSNSEPTSYGQLITFTAVVTAQTGPTPMGNVVFSIGGQPAATVALVNGIASYTTSTIPMTPGIAIVATYQGNSLDALSTSNTLTQAVSGYTTNTTLTSSANPAVYGQPIAFTATVTANGGPTPVGTVYFHIYGGPSGYPEIAVPLVNGVATYVTSSFPVTTSGIEVYAGYAGTDGQSSSSLIQVVTAPAGSVNFSNGFNGSGAVLKVNGAASASNNVLALTPYNTKNQAGSAFFKTKQNIQAFTTDFILFEGGGDGFTFTIQSNSDDAVGGIGGGLGYKGIPNSVAIKFDLFNNVGEGSNSTGLFTDGAFPGIPALDLTPAGISLANDFEMPAHITYDGANLIMTLTNPTTGKYWSHTWAIDIPSVVGGATAYVGFTGSTGDESLNTVISAWTFNSGAPAPNYPTFNSTGLTLNGSSAVTAAMLVLTNGGKQETSSAFYTLPQYIGAFVTDFDLETASASADGFTFTIQNNAPTALGGNGGGLGYKGIPNSVAIKFDLYDNEGESPNSTGLYTDGAFPGPADSIDLTGTGIDLHGPDRIKAHVTYNGVILTMTLTDAITGAAWSHIWPIDIPTTVGATNAYIGFTAATGGLTATQTISRWTYNPGISTLQSEP